MIDEEWLSELRFEAYGGSHVVGLAGLGSEHVVLKAIEADGEEIVLKTSRHGLGFHIRELPLYLTAKKEYDLGRVNDKLRQLVGRDDVDEMTMEYDRLACSVLSNLHMQGMTVLLMKAAAMGLLENEMTAFLKSPGIRRRLQHWAAMRAEANDITDLIIRVNGAHFPIADERIELIQWAKASLKAIDALPMPALRPDLLTKNPLYVWGAAAMDGFFTDDELPAVAAYIEKHFGRLTDRDDCRLLLDQVSAIAQLLVFFLEETEVDRFVKLCAECGFILALLPKRPVNLADDDDDPDVDVEPRRSVWQRLRGLFSGR